MSSVTIRPVRTKRDEKAFIKFQWKPYEGNPYWVPPLLLDRRKLIDRQKNPFYKHADAEFFLAERDGEVVRHRAEVQEVLFEDPAFVAEAEDELAKPVRRIALHDVPNDRPVADRQHRFRQELVRVANPGSLTAAEDDDLHGPSGAHQERADCSPPRWGGETNWSARSMLGSLHGA